MVGITATNGIITTNRIDTLSANARQLLEDIIKTWLNNTEHGRTLLHAMSCEDATIAVLELLDRGAMVIKMGPPPPGMPLGALSLTLPDSGRAFGQARLS